MRIIEEDFFPSTLALIKACLQCLINKALKDEWKNATDFLTVYDNIIINITVTMSIPRAAGATTMIVQY